MMVDHKLGPQNTSVYYVILGFLFSLIPKRWCLVCVFLFFLKERPVSNITVF